MPAWSQRPYARIKLEPKRYTTVFETDRLIISQLNDHDATFMLALVNSRGWLQYIGDRKVNTLREAKSYIKLNYAKDYQNGIGLFCLRSKRCGNPIGTCGLIDRGTLPYPDIGFALLDEYAGYGYVLEAGRHIISKSRELLLVDKICAITLPTNSRSINTLINLGLKKKKKITLKADDEELLYFEG